MNELKVVDFATPIRNAERKIAEQRAIRKYLMREQTQLFVSELSYISGGRIWVSDYGTIWLTLREQPGFTTEANPELFDVLEFISDYTEWSFKNVQLRSLDLPESFQRQYIFSFRWHAIDFRIVVDCYLDSDSTACIRVQTGTKTIKESKWIEHEVETPIYEFVC